MPLRLLIIILSLAMSGPARSDPPLLAYAPPPPGQWSYISDQVMGGVSEGQAQVEGPEGAPYLHLTGRVSTENRGGFLQVRVKLELPLPQDAQGVVVETRGNGEGYFIHLRTRGTVLPWQYYQAPIPSGPDWQVIRLPFTAFRPSGAMLRDTPRPQDVTSLGAVAYGRDHQADLSFRWIGVY